METRVVNLREESYEVYIGRKRDGSSKYGNPYVMGIDGTRDEVIKKYRDSVCRKLDSEEWTLQEMRDDLQGKILGCFCKPMACHGDVLKEFVDEP